MYGFFRSFSWRLEFKIRLGFRLLIGTWTDGDTWVVIGKHPGAFRMRDAIPVLFLIFIFRDQMTDDAVPLADFVFKNI